MYLDSNSLLLNVDGHDVTMWAEQLHCVFDKGGFLMLLGGFEAPLSFPSKQALILVFRDLSHGSVAPPAAEAPAGAEGAPAGPNGKKGWF